MKNTGRRLCKKYCKWFKENGFEKKEVSILELANFAKAYEDLESKFKEITRLTKIPLWSNKYTKKCGDDIKVNRKKSKFGGVIFKGEPEVITLEYHTRTGEIELWYGTSDLGLPNYTNHSEAFKKAKELAEYYNTIIVVDYL